MRRLRATCQNVEQVGPYVKYSRMSITLTNGHFKTVFTTYLLLCCLFKQIFLFFNRNSIPPTTTVANLKVKQNAAIGKIHVDVGFWGGIIPGNQNELKSLWNEGVVGFKCFLCPSGVSEFPHVDRNDLELAFEELKNTNGLIAVCTIQNR